MKNIAGIPKILLDVTDATAIGRMVADCFSWGSSQKPCYLRKGQVCWTVHAWDKTHPLEFWHNGIITLYFINGSLVERTSVNLEYFKVEKKLPLWESKIFPNATDIMKKGTKG